MYKNTVGKDDETGKEWNIWESRERANVRTHQYEASELDCILRNGELEEPLKMFEQRNDTIKVDFKTLVWTQYVRIKRRQWDKKIQ